MLLIVSGAALALAATRYAPSSGANASARGSAVNGDAVWKAGTRPAPSFDLTDQRGRSVSLASLRGRPLLLTFLDSKCTTLCPIVGHQLGVVERHLGGQPVRLVIVSVDPADTRHTVAAAARKWGWHGHWQWLMGTPARLAPVWRAYGIGVQPTATDIAHSMAVYVIDGQGDERAGFLPPLAISRLVSDVRLLQRG
ncbi:MAG TPA: SCO family protein [Pseudonocardiaceae bacterium]|nr:SCO family protein [Pseudonocardiaceae bacterium]